MSLLDNPNVATLFLEKVGEDTFSGITVNDNRPTIYGGQVFAQALNAVYQTVDKDLVAHSMHSYFIQAGNPHLPILFKVSRLRDGRSISTRHVTAFQNDVAIFSMLASCQYLDEGFEHQIAMPEVPPPESAMSDAEFMSKLPAAVTAIARPKHTWPFDNRTIDPLDWITPEKRPAKAYMWFKAIDECPLDTQLQHMLLAFASDTSILGTAMYPHGVNYLNPKMQVATIDHSLWIHRDVNVNDWLLYSYESPNAINGRGLAFGYIFNTQGQLVASAAQEGVMRIRKK